MLACVCVCVFGYVCTCVGAWGHANVGTGFHTHRENCDFELGGKWIAEWQVAARDGEGRDVEVPMRLTTPEYVSP